MLRCYEIRFDGLPPSPITIFEKLKESTGLDIVLSPKQNQFLHPLFDYKLFSFYEDENCICICAGYPKETYLLGATLVTLINMGGKYDGYISDEFKMPWKNLSLNSKMQLYLDKILFQTWRIFHLVFFKPVELLLSAFSKLLN